MQSQPDSLIPEPAININGDRHPASGKPLRILIVGGVAGGASTAARVRRLSESAEIVLFERGPHVSFANCGLPYYVGGEIEDRADLQVQTPASLKARFNLDVRVNTEVLRIDRAARTVLVKNRQTGEEYSERYDKLVLATGAAPIRPPIPGLERPLHFMVRNIPDVERIVEWADGESGKRVVVVGGGYIGLEMAEQLRQRGLEVTMVEALPQVMAPLDPEMAAWLHEELRGNGVRLCLGDGVASFDPPGVEEPAGASIVVLKSGLRLPADAVILGLGVKPEVSLARDAGLEIGSLGGVRVDAGMRTTDPDIFAVGDAVEVRDGVTGNWALIPLAGPANRQGRIAADNLFGGNSEYPGTFGTAVLRLFGLTAACTGSGAKALTRAGIPFETVHLHPGSHAGYFPGAEPIALKLLFAPGTGRLLGAQAVGRDGVDKRMDVLAVALKAGMTVHDLAELELCYAPPFGSAKDPVNLAGMAAQNVLAGRVRQVQWDEVAGLDPAKFQLLDVRSEEEHAKGFIPGSLFIPVNALRERMPELPRDRELVVYCQSGLRSYIAARMLEQHGFKVRNLSGAWRTWRAATA